MKVKIEVHDPTKAERLAQMVKTRSVLVIDGKVYDISEVREFKATFEIEGDIDVTPLKDFVGR